MAKDQLTTFVFVLADKIISPPLVTVREYGRWLDAVYDEYTCNYELYLRETVDGDRVLSYHPGTRIGSYFDTTSFNSDRYQSWYIHQGSTMMYKLNRLKLAEDRDVAAVRAHDKKGLRLLRLYSIHQIELYVRTKIDRDFQLNNFAGVPKKIVLRKSDMQYVIMPQINKSKRSLLDTTRVSMTVEEIESKLGHKISIISEGETK